MEIRHILGLEDEEVCEDFLDSFDQPSSSFAIKVRTLLHFVVYHAGPLWICGFEAWCTCS